MNPTITLYVVGETEYDVDSQFPFDSYESAYSYIADKPGLQVFEIQATLDLSTVVPF